MELIITLIALIIIWCVAFMVGAKQGANRTINQIKKDGGYFDMEITGAVYPYKTSSVNDDTMGTKIPPCVGHELESQKEIEKADIDFMHKWIREKSGK
jgi:hypothetical protein